MGQKINPTSFRLPLSKDWQSKWFARKADYRRYLSEDLQIRSVIAGKLGRRASVNRVDIERSPNMVTIIIHSARPGMIIGRGGSGIEELKKQLETVVSSPLKLNIEEVKKPELHAQIVADNIAGQLERRISYRKAVKMAVEAARQGGAKGVKISVAGRLGGIEMARNYKESSGSIPLHTLRADIDYGQTAAHTVAGLIGVKVWINQQEIS